MYSQKFDCLLCLKQDSFFPYIGLSNGFFKAVLKVFSICFSLLSSNLGFYYYIGWADGFFRVGLKLFSTCFSLLSGILGYTTISDNLTDFSGLG